MEQKKFDRAKAKRRGLKRFFASFKYSVQGLTYAAKNEQSILIHFIATALVIILGLSFKITGLEWILIFVAITLVLGVELLNTAIEAIVDMVTIEIHPLAKIAKDCASAAVFVFSIVAAIIGLFIFIPYVTALF